MKFLRVFSALLLPLSALAAEKGPLPVAELKRSEPVNFDGEILPFLSENCLSCHCKTTTKGGLNLETPELMLKGGENGPAVLPGKAAESLAFQAAIHKDADLAMPPRDNKAKAKNLTPEQLALLQLWIDQGAKVSPKTERIVQWQTLPANLNPIFAVAVTGDGQFAACSRANRLFIYRLPSARLVFQTEAHRDQINAIAFSPDGTIAATGGYREVKLWRRAPAKPFTFHVPANRAAMSKDGWKVTAGRDGTVTRWRNSENGPDETQKLDGSISALAFSPDETQFATADGKRISIWAKDSGLPIKTAEAPAEITALAWLADGRIATADGKVIRIWDRELAAGQELKGHAGAVTALAGAGAGRLLSGSADGAAWVWDMAKGEPALKLAHGGPIVAVAFRPDGQRFATAGENGITKLWNAAGKPAGEASGNRLVVEAAAVRDRTLQVETGTVAFRKAEIAAAEKAVTAAQDHVKKSEEVLGTKIKDLEAKKAAVAKAQEEKKAADQAVVDANAEVEKAAAEPESPTAKTAAAKQKAAVEKVAPAEKKAADAQAAVEKVEGDRKAAESAIAQAKAEIEKTTGEVARTKAAAEAAEAIRKQAEDAAALAKKELPAAVKPIRAVAFTADSQLLVTAGDDGLIHTWNADDAKPLEVIASHKGKVESLTAAPTGQQVFSGGDDAEARMWELAPKWTLERTIGTSTGKSPLTDRVNAVAFSHDGKLLATGSGEPSRTGEVKLWNPATGALVRDLPNFHVDAVLAVEFSADDKYLATGAADKLARVIELATGKALRSFEGHTHHVLGVAWSLDGRTLATSGADNVVKIWNVLTGDRLKNIEGYEKEVTAVRFTGATTTLLTSSGDNKVRLVNTAGAEVRSLPVPEFMESAAVTADGQTIVAGGQDGVLRVWNAADGKVIAAFEK
jgi:WD40 repeat protein